MLSLWFNTLFTEFSTHPCLLKEACTVSACSVPDSFLTGVLHWHELFFFQFIYGDKLSPDSACFVDMNAMYCVMCYILVH